MGKILLIFLCVFAVVVCGRNVQKQSINSNSNTSESKIPEGFQNKVEELEKFHEEFKDFKVNLVELSAAFLRFHQSLTKNRTGETGRAKNPGGNQHSPSNTNTNANGQSTREILIVRGERVIVANGISSREGNGRWEELQVCPKSTIVTGHRFRCLSGTGLTGIELKCTQKYAQDEPIVEHILVINFENQVVKDAPRGKWENWKNGSGSAFAEGFSFSRGEMSLGRTVKNYNIIYHSGKQIPTHKQSTVDSSKMYRKCPPDHAICGLTAMMDKTGLGILTALGLKCCAHCVPKEKWVTIHQFNNTGVSNKKQQFEAKVGLQRSLKESAHFSEIPHQVLHEEFSARFGKLRNNSNSTEFDWFRSFYTVWTAETRINGTYICEGRRSCGFKQLVGQCGSVRVPVGRFCEVSVPVGSSIPDSCNLASTPSNSATKSQTIIYIYTYVQNATHNYTDYHNNSHNETQFQAHTPIFTHSTTTTVAPPTTTAPTTTKTTVSTRITTSESKDPTTSEGTPADLIDPIPYQLSIRYENPEDGIWYHICGAVILDEKTAVTAAHCFQNSTEKCRYRVVAGENILGIPEKGEQVLHLKKIIIHPEYKDFSHGNDIAILHVDKFKLNKFARAVLLLPFSNKNLSISTAVVSGWNKFSENSGASAFKSLQKWNVSILPPEDCLEQLKDEVKASVREGIVCAINPVSRTCVGDFGGPLVVQNYTLGNSTGNLLVGIHSFTASKCSTGAFTGISHFYEWIRANRATTPAIMTPTTTNTAPISTQKPTEETSVGKTRVDPSDPIPYQLSIRYNKNPPDGEWSHICDGVILDEKTAITAAHCFDETKDVDRYRVVAGANLLNSTDPEEQVLQLKKVVVHPKYTTATNGNDLAILHVDKFQFNKNVAGVWLSPFSNKELTDKPAVNSGWDDVSSKSGLSNSLLKETVSILSPEDCLNRLQSQSYAKVREGVVCARNPLARTCTGDSGGPLVIQNYPPGDFNRNFLVGIASFALVNCAQPVKVGVFTEISSYYNWIQENRATPRGCGGFIRLDGQEKIVYTVPEELRGQKSVCVWVVATPGASAIKMQVFHNPKALFQSDSTLFAIHDFTEHSFSHSKILKENKTLMIEQPFFVLYFRTNSAAQNSGFHLQLKEAGEKTTQKAVKYLELTGGATSEIQEFKYPLPNASEYANDERTFIIVKPGARHAKLELDLKSVSTQKLHDWMTIFSVASEPVSHFRFSGDDWTSGRVFEAEEDEPFIIYFHADTSNSGFEFSYAEKRIFEVKSRPLTFFKDTDFAGPEIQLHVRNFCQDLPRKWDNKVSSLNSTLCLTFYEDKGCSSRSQQLNGSHSNLSLYDLDDKISSFELCETTNKREESPFFLTAYEFENYTGDSTKLSLDCGCVGYKFGWNDRINSIKNPQRLCVIGYDDVRCKGTPILINSDSPSFQSKGMNNRLTSFRICPGESNCPEY